ncbi:hypothetical protein GQ53DRAFT_797897 [Thozetella sp. PMI_491]|nr:hypothetical protein GQ53DRAFT_797897 [Thozetella sp. PMI_491]
MSSTRGVCLTQVQPAGLTETNVDIIAIHGLDTKSPDTWIWKSKQPNERAVDWLAAEDMLPSKVGPARIFTCDWPADLFQRSNSIPMVLDELARLLLAGIQARPSPANEQARRESQPILFIASCLGGIILMKALVIASTGDEYLSLRRATRGAIFLATPFRGTAFQDIASWAIPSLQAWASLRNQAVTQLLNSVKGSTFELQELVRSFTQLCQDKDHPCQVHTFYEKGKTSLHRKIPLTWLVPPCVLGLFCQPKLLVDSGSASLDIVPNPLALDRPHRTMNKFHGPGDPGYNCVVEKVEEILRKIRKNSLLEEADAWIRDQVYTKDRLEIQRLSGNSLPMDQCYINLAIVEQPRESASHSEGRSEEGDTAPQPSPFSLLSRQKVETPDKKIQIELPTLFNNRKGPNGRAGVGKTTLCKKIVYEFARDTWHEWNERFDRVLWVPLRKLKRRPGRRYNLDELFYDEYFYGEGQDDGRRLAKELRQTVKTNRDSGRTLFLLDGLDEISELLDPDHEMSSFLRGLLNQPNVIITSRPHVNLPSITLDLELETIGFYPDQVEDYIKMAFTNYETNIVDQRTINEIRSFLQKHWLVQSLMRIPIQLDILCFAWNAGFDSKKLDTMTALYRAIESRLWKKDISFPRLEKIYGQNQVTKSVIEDASPKRIERLIPHHISFLESLAFSGLYSDVINFEFKQTSRISDNFTPDLIPGEVLPHLSFLRTSDRSSEYHNRNYHFLHLTFQEYFAARYFVRRLKARDRLEYMELDRSEGGQVQGIKPTIFLAKHKYTARYDVFWRFVAGLLDAKDEDTKDADAIKAETFFFEKIKEEPRDLLGPAHQRLVMHCLSEVSTKMPLREVLEKELAQWLLFECEFTGRSHLAREMEFPEEALHATLKQESDTVKIIILRSLARRPRVPPKILELGTWLLGNVSRSLKEEVCKILQSSRESLLKDALKVVAIWLEDQDQNVRYAAAKVLRQQSDLPKEILQAIVARLEHQDRDHQDRDVRYAATDALRQQSDLPVEILQAIIAQLEDQDRGVRYAATKALAIIAWLEDQDQDVRYAATEALAIVVRLKHQDQDVRYAATKVLPIIARLKHQDRDVRYAATDALRQQSDLPEEILQAIVAQLEDQDRGVILRRHRVFYSTLHNSPSVKSLYEIFLRRSFTEQWSWYIEGACHKKGLGG